MPPRTQSVQAVAQAIDLMRELRVGIPGGYGPEQINLEKVIEDINPILRGFVNYFKLASCKSELRAVMSWLRRRLRAIQMKQWKKPNKLHRRLRQLGYKGEFKRIKMVSWKNTACQQAHMAMPNKWFKELGRYHPPQLEEGQLLLF